MTEAQQRAAIVAEALTWEGTPYLSGAQVKGAGVDCAMLPNAVYSAVGLAPRQDIQYPQDWMMHRDEEKFLSFITPYARQIEPADALPGDLIIWRFGRTFSHSAIILDLPEVLHAAIRGGAVIRADVTRDVDLLDRECRYYSVFGKRKGKS